MPLDKEAAKELKQMIKRGRSTTLNFALALGKKPEDSALLMHHKRDGKLLLRRVKKTEGVMPKRSCHGTLTVSGKNINLNCATDPPPGVVKKFRVFFSVNQLAMKLKVLAPDGSEFEVEDDAEDDEERAKVLAKRAADLKRKVESCAPGLQKRLQVKLNDAVRNIRSGHLDEADEQLGKLETAIDLAQASGTAKPKDDGAERRWISERDAIQPQYEDAIDGDCSDTAKLRVVWEFAHGKAEAQDFGNAVKSLGQLAKMLAQGDDGAELAMLRQALVKRLLQITPTEHAQPLEARKFLANRRNLRLAVASADRAALAKLDRLTDALERENENLGKIALARHNAQEALARAQAAVKSASSRISQSCLEQGVGLLAKVRARLAKASTPAQFKTSQSEADRIAPYLAEAEAYKDVMVRWRYDCELYVGSLPVGDDDQQAEKAAMGQLRDQLMLSADAMAAAGKFDAATAELEKFATQTVMDRNGNAVSADDKRMEQSKSFAKALAEFVRDTVPQMRLIEKSGLPKGARVLQPRYDAIKERGYRKGEWDEAVQDLRDFALEIAEIVKVAAKQIEYAPVAAEQEVRTAFQQMKTRCDDTPPDYGGALAALLALDGTDFKQMALYRKRRASLSNTVSDLLSELPDPPKSSLALPWDKAEKTDSTVDQLNLLDEVEALLPEIETWWELSQDLAQDVSHTDPDNEYKLLDRADAFGRQGQLSKAISALGSAREDVVHLSRYLSDLQRLAELRISYPPDQSDILRAIDTARDTSRNKAKSHDWSAATAALDAVFSDPTLQARLAEIAVYLRHKDRVGRLQARLLDSIPQANAKKRLLQPWEVAIKTAEAKRDYVAAADALTNHEPLVKEAQLYVGARVRAINALAAMDRAAQASPGSRDDIYPASLDKAKLDKAMTVADALAGKGEFAKSAAAFKAIMASAQSGMKTAARALEKSDGGHYLIAHGPPPDTTEEDLKTRLLTGYRKDYDKDGNIVQKKVPARAASQFTDIETFLSTRERAMSAAKDKGVDIDADTLPLGTRQFQIKIHTDSEVPAGKGFISDCPKIEFRGGELKESDVQENYRECVGLTRTTTVFMFHFADPDGGSRKITRLKHYVKLFKAANGGAEPTEYKGRWVVHQHYPTPIGFDPDTGTYAD